MWKSSLNFQGCSKKIPQEWILIHSRKRFSLIFIWSMTTWSNLMRTGETETRRNLFLEIKISSQKSFKRGYVFLRKAWKKSSQITGTQLEKHFWDWILITMASLQLKIYWGILEDKITGLVKTVMKQVQVEPLTLMI